MYSKRWLYFLFLASLLSACVAPPQNRLIKDAYLGNLGSVKSLLSNTENIDINASGVGIFNRFNPITMAVEGNHPDMMKFLLEQGADVNGTDVKGNSALVYAAMHDYYDMGNLLIVHGADVNLKNHLGVTPLMFAAKYNSINVAKLLVGHGANVMEINAQKGTAIDIAKRNHNMALAKYLEEHAADQSQSAASAAPATVPSESSAPSVASAPSVPSSPAVPAYSLPLAPPDYHEAEHADDYAVVVGIANYQNLPPAEFADRDAEAVKNYLLALGYPERNIVLLTGDHATRTGLVKEIESWLPENVDAKSTVFFYYSGHGAPDVESGAAYLVPWDGDPEYLSDTAYPLSRLYKELGALPAKHVVVALDSCFSGAGGRSVLAAGVRPLVTEVDEGFVNAGGKIVALSASRANQVSGDLPQAGHGLFTYYLLKGLNGGALDSDGHVTLESLYQYIAPRVEDAARRVNRDQAPQLWPADLGSSSNLVLR